MEREEALRLIKQEVKTKNLIKHMLAAEAVMRRLAEELGQDEELWALTGLLHDLDYDRTMDQPEQHGLLGAQILEEKGLPPELVQAVKAHNEVLGVERQTLLDKALYAADPVTGLLVAAALIHPQKKLAAIDLDFVMNRFKEKSFARGADRGQIESCSELNLSLERFMTLSLEAMQSIAADLGL
ncbi:MAG: HDIG domain-containing metalloprotein [Dethiobacteria bacterium]|jgi:putative nucleotidyltransferase with HDIG domain|nr:HDIG domain-containing protein [Bacillota bacterium]HOB29020.1 HDIG domain-containing protein [Bacillota bacterium]HPZ41152.1 HDIG domain-containing protein [Bacillota bacterium]HQD52651.1 HDIG domain-containing protein [Bacillota bacterium]